MTGAARPGAAGDRGPAPCPRTSEDAAPSGACPCSSAAEDAATAGPGTGAAPGRPEDAAAASPGTGARPAETAPIPAESPGSAAGTGARTAAAEAETPATCPRPSQTCPRPSATEAKALAGSAGTGSRAPAEPQTAASAARSRPGAAPAPAKSQPAVAARPGTPARPARAASRSAERGLHGALTPVRGPLPGEPAVAHPGLALAPPLVGAARMSVVIQAREPVDAPADQGHSGHRAAAEHDRARAERGNRAHDHDNGEQRPEQDPPPADPAGRGGRRARPAAARHDARRSGQLVPRPGRPGTACGTGRIRPSASARREADPGPGG